MWAELFVFLWSSKQQHHLHIRLLSCYDLYCNYSYDFMYACTLISLSNIYKDKQNKFTTNPRNSQTSSFSSGYTGCHLGNPCYIRWQSLQGCSKPGRWKLETLMNQQTMQLISIYTAYTYCEVLHSFSMF